MDREIKEILYKEDNVIVCKANRIRWHGHIQRRVKETITVINWMSVKGQSRGRPKPTWLEQVK